MTCSKCGMCVAVLAQEHTKNRHAVTLYKLSMQATRTHIKHQQLVHVWCLQKIVCRCLLLSTATQQSSGKVSWRALFSGNFNLLSDSRHQAWCQEEED
jgi:hypothetical protein